MIYITSDHGGYKLKNEIVQILRSIDVKVEDLGPKELNEGDDYPEYTLKLIEKLKENLSDNKGIVICRNGVGVSVLANKFKGIRAALSWNPEHAVSTRNDDDSNVLALPADYIDSDTAYQTVGAWLNKDFSGDEKHIRRLEVVKEFGQ
ncbi:hypothetical protein A2619_02550 [candidate division WWE3 bacterium RIFOXYD1_FULL_39_9]|uniref:Ribose-5-phosphate isomerase n=1 Tax=candidate division WWE3 bacterium RIFOXYD1_FULL_39_9 TaxID=1802649 RepID=A0A1F4X5S2_UNCKA|nr:MAG: hypothetical protein A2619_02550 [candidate division WWE3 bacterium RIFOXYD1_FULL_39_9]